MGSLLPIGFAAPWVLTAFVALPVLWWLLRTTPPQPAYVKFPPLRLLLSLHNKEETPQHTPWWLILLRLLLAAILIVAMAGPVWKPLDIAEPKAGPLWVIVDNGWDASADWDRQIRMAEMLVEGASQNNRTVMLVTTADGPAQPMRLSSAQEVADQLRALSPRGWQAARSELLPALQKQAAQSPPGAILWFSSPLEEPSTTSFARGLANIARATDVQERAFLIYRSDTPVYALKHLQNSAGAMTTTILRHPAPLSETLTVRAYDRKQRVIAEQTVELEPRQNSAQISLELPSELRNDITKLSILGKASSGSTVLVDEKWRRRKLGLFAGGFADRSQPLLSPLYYLERALSPFADLPPAKTTDISTAVSDYFDKGISVLVLAEVGTLPKSTEAEIASWVSKGGTLVRFAGPQLPEKQDSLIPVALRMGERKLGGSLSWKEPQALKSFSPNSPFRAISLPNDVTVNRQVLAEPTADLPDRTWASLEDGTPLVTAKKHGNGTIVFFHVTPDTKWSNLPLSGGFVDMLRAITSISSTAVLPPQNETDGPASASALPLLKVLNGYGKLIDTSVNHQPILERDFANTHPSRETPPGLYGSPEAARALNLIEDDDTLVPLDLSALSMATTLEYPSEKPLDLRGWFFSIAILLALLDTLALLWLSGKLRSNRVTASATFLLITTSLILTSTDKVWAQNSAEDFALDASLDTRLAYVITGSPEVDEISRAGLFGLTRLLTDRTALEPETPIGLDLQKHELAFFPIIYWPIDANMQLPGPQAMSRIGAYMRNGGTILFDTRDAYGPSGSNSQNKQKLQQLLQGLDIPSLEPVPHDHVLTKTFYILDEFPGRYNESPMWVQASASSSDGSRPVRAGDGVSPIMISGNDLAAAWAIDPEGNYLYPTIPADSNQREMAARVGINILMYTMTGNYKADQVHIPALLERIGQ
ncbi:hypothetical protein PsAD2_02756 [Pseudovibrio axinellae]|uniref:Aerotolerance regulator N-terminal domain-containing protein n=1 Tax=Pseudovibrio axinellae TaxID=989403 RepID=A0A165XTH2_9HYPH|nr:DUF4159 domain-containing protein [Pseudovibrio axinellae]KZL18022.1 hypothetical protein PsAD2_02756 [Pseudovibrio axinellae]SER13196.1 N-terminal double-transmembrane domain-containing protein [Pseudovibrio axinellae]